jgi:hypothetical protein
MNETAFIVILIVNRVLEGWSYGLIQCMIYGVASQELKASEFNKYARTCSACAGLGESLGMLSVILTFYSFDNRTILLLSWRLLPTLYFTLWSTHYLRICLLYVWCTN